MSVTLSLSVSVLELKNSRAKAQNTIIFFLNLFIVGLFLKSCLKSTNTK